MATRLREAREHRGTDLKRAAKGLGMPQYRLRDIEGCHLKNLKSSALRQYIDYLGLGSWFARWRKANSNLAARLGLERGPPRDFTPCRFDSDDRVIRALATVHAELMLIHPCREGNGRAGRLLAILMGLQAKLPPLDLSGIKGKKRQQYFAAVRAGVGRDYKPMERVFSDVVRRSRRAASRAGSGPEIP